MHSKAYSSPFRPALALLLFFTLLLGGVYPLMVAFMVKPVAPPSELLIGKHFTKPEYFWGRPSATTPPYNAAASTASHRGVLDAQLHKDIEARIKTLRAADPANDSPVPIELVTASGSGLDPHISPAAAHYQAGRVARARGMKAAQVGALIDLYTESPQLGILGKQRVNVAALNRALDEKK